MSKWIEFTMKWHGMLYNVHEKLIWTTTNIKTDYINYYKTHKNYFKKTLNVSSLFESPNQ